MPWISQRSSRLRISSGLSLTFSFSLVIHDDLLIVPIYIVMFEGHIFQKDFIYFYLLKRQRSQERKRNNPPSMHPNAQNCQTRLKSEAQNSIHAFHLGDRSPSTESISKHLHQSRGKTPHRHSNMGSL